MLPPNGRHRRGLLSSAYLTTCESRHAASGSHVRRNMRIVGSLAAASLSPAPPLSSAAASSGSCGGAGVQPRDPARAPPPLTVTVTLDASSSATVPGAAPKEEGLPADGRRRLDGGARAGHHARSDEHSRVSCCIRIRAVGARRSARPGLQARGAGEREWRMLPLRASRPWADQPCTLGRQLLQCVARTTSYRICRCRAECAQNVAELEAGMTPT